MSYIRKLKDNNNDIYPVTVEEAIFDSNGTNLAEKLDKTMVWGEAVSETGFELEFNLVSRIEALENNAGQSDKLLTESKDIVGAINELFQNVDNGKQLIADAIDDESITKDSTFEAMSEAIKNAPKINFATGVHSSAVLATAHTAKNYTFTIPINVDFVPTRIRIFSSSLKISDGIRNNIPACVDTILGTDKTWYFQAPGDGTSAYFSVKISNITSESFNITIYNKSTWYDGFPNGFTWEAM